MREREREKRDERNEKRLVSANCKNEITISSLLILFICWLQLPARHNSGRMHHKCGRRHRCNIIFHFHLSQRHTRCIVHWLRRRHDTRPYTISWRTVHTLALRQRMRVACRWYKLWPNAIRQATCTHMWTRWRRAPPSSHTRARSERIRYRMLDSKWLCVWHWYDGEQSQMCWLDCIMERRNMSLSFVSSHVTLQVCARFVRSRFLNASSTR